MATIQMIINCPATIFYRNPVFFLNESIQSRPNTMSSLSISSKTLIQFSLIQINNNKKTQSMPLYVHVYNFFQMTGFDF